jgi:plastocyanin
MLSQTLLLSSIAAIASAAIFNVQVADNNITLKFTPNTTIAAVGDTVVFHFFPKKHDVVQGSLEAPCNPLAGGFFSGFMPTAAGESNKTFAITVKDAEPIWYYCSQALHCKFGMVGVINPP